MIQVQETLTVTIDEKPYEVSTLSESVQQMIALMDDWRQKDQDLSNKILMTRAAIRDIQNSILVTIKKDEEEAAAPKEEAE